MNGDIAPLWEPQGESVDVKLIEEPNRVGRDPKE